MDSSRAASFEQDYKATAVDKFGIWLSTRKILNHVVSFDNATVADIGCGFKARFTQSILPKVRRAIVVDVSLAPELKSHRKITAIEGHLPDALTSISDGSIDAVICNNVIEHLWDPSKTLSACRRIMAPSGVLFINVPSWRGKWFLEFSAFKLNLSPRSEMNDHKMYYDKRDLWPLLVRAGFLPELITVRTHKFGLNTYGVCRHSRTSTEKLAG